MFIKITKTKVLAAYGQIVDILFANKKFPMVVEPTPVPEGIAEFAHLETPLDQMVEDPYGYAGDGREMPFGATEATPSMDFLGGLQQRYANAPIQTRSCPHGRTSDQSGSKGCTEHGEANP